MFAGSVSIGPRRTHAVSADLHHPHPGVRKGPPCCPHLDFSSTGYAYSPHRPHRRSICGYILLLCRIVLATSTVLLCRGSKAPREKRPQPCTQGNKRLGSFNPKPYTRVQDGGMQSPARLRSFARAVLQ